MSDGSTAPERVEPHEWLRALAAELAVEPLDASEVDDLLSLAGTAAHTAERWVAPVSTYLAARAEVPPAAARVIVERLAASMHGVPTAVPQAEARDPDGESADQ